MKVSEAGHAWTADAHYDNGQILKCTSTMMRQQTDVDACQLALPLALGAVASDTVVIQMHTRAIPVLEGLHDGCAALRPQLA